MSTRSIIAKKVDDGFMVIYNHFDGYPDGVGTQLVEDFNSAEAVDHLMEKGDGSTLTESYKSRGETNVDATFVEGDLKKLRDYASGVGSYLYVWDNGWVCYNLGTNRKLKIPQ